MLTVSLRSDDAPYGARIEIVDDPEKARPEAKREAH
jgi:hypothetical protein